MASLPPIDQALNLPFRSQTMANLAGETETTIDYNITQREIEDLKEAAIAAKATAYCPYSNFRVGAAILSTSGEIITGANVENASSPVGSCAERVAVGKAVTEGHLQFRALAVSADTKSPCSPCGMCRQFVREFCGRGMKVYMFAKESPGQNPKAGVTTLGALLPMSFGPDDLKDGQGGGGGEKKKIPGME